MTAPKPLSDLQSSLDSSRPLIGVITLPHPFKLYRMSGKLPDERSDSLIGSGIQFTNGWVWVFVVAEGLNNYLSFDSIELMRLFFDRVPLHVLWLDPIESNFNTFTTAQSITQQLQQSTPAVTAYSFLVVNNAMSASGCKIIAQGYKFDGGCYAILFMFKLPFCLLFDRLSDLDKYFPFPVDVLKISSSLFDLSLNNIYLWGRDYFCDRY